jgi:protein tyrosine/serine phosphatase
MTHFNSRMIVVAGALIIVTLAAITEAAWCQEDKRASDLPNFGRVTDTLYRGGQPAPAGFDALQAMGVGIVVNFRDERDEVAAEKSQVESLGIKYVGIPWNGRNEPSNAQIVQFLDLIRANPQTKIFVHCQRGADRTGVMVAAYRIAVEHKSVSEAVSEMRQFHYNWFWLPQLERYVRSLPALLQKDSQFSAYATLPSPTEAPAVATVTMSSVVSPGLGR